MEQPDEEGAGGGLALPRGSHPVCPRCGTAADASRWCTQCGLNLVQHGELPTADAYAAKIREEGWLRAHKPASSARIIDNRVRENFSRGDRLLVVGTAALLAVGALGVIAALLALLVAGDEYFPSGARIARGFGLVAAAVWVAAFGSAARAFYARSTVRQTRLGTTALVAAVAAGAGLVAAIITMGVEAAHHFGTARVASDVFTVGMALEVPALLIARQAFIGGSRRSATREARDRQLGRATMIFVIAYASGLIARVLGVISYTNAGTLGGYTAGLVMGAVAQAVFTVAVAIAAFAFFEAKDANAQGESVELARRDMFLAASAGVMGVGYLIAAIGGMVGSAAEAGAGVAGKAVAAGWIDAFASIAGIGAVGCVATGFYLRACIMLDSQVTR